ncbi:MAG: MoaD/ThiS family protein [Acidimicrobiales bacterium]|jgi:molybdopterin converting factor small subunit
MTGSSTGPSEGHTDALLVTVLFFASAREAAGTHSAPFGFAGRTIAQLAGELVGTYGPDFERVLGTCAIWVNGAAAAPSRLLCAGDEVAVLPPVSGGAAGSL